MSSVFSLELLRDKDVVNEINRYKWLESEKVGKDIGFERASREWINKCSKQYLNRHPGKSALLWVKTQSLFSILTREIL